MRHGTGTYKYKNGDIYKGSFKKNLYEGKGLFKYSNGNLYEEIFKKG